MAHGTMELPCLGLYRDHSTALLSASKEKLIAAGDTALQNKTVCPTARGLLLVRDTDTLATFLRSPQDGGQVHLPPLGGLDDDTLVDSHCLLSDEPSAPGCVVLVVEAARRSRPTSAPSRRADRGKFYFNGSPTVLGVLEFSPHPVFSFVVVDDDDEEDVADGDGAEPRGFAVFLVESGDELYKVSLRYGGEVGGGFFVHRWDFAELRWRGVGDLGGRTFLLSLFYFGASCAGGAGEHGLQRDCIYIAYPRKEMKIVDVKEGTKYLRKLDEAPAADKALWLLPASP